MLSRAIEFAGERLGVPSLAGIGAFHRLTVVVKQAELEVETACGIPAERAPGTGEALILRPHGQKTDQIQARGRRNDLLRHGRAIQPHRFARQRAAPSLTVQAQIRVVTQGWQHATQVLQGLLQAQQILIEHATERQFAFGMALALVQRQGDVDLLHIAGLAHLTLIETDKAGHLGAVGQGETLLAHDLRLQMLEQRAEMLTCIHQAAPPKTSISAKTQAGEACPTRITWLGSPLPQ